MEERKYDVCRNHSACPGLCDYQQKVSWASCAAMQISSSGAKSSQHLIYLICLHI